VEYQEEAGMTGSERDVLVELRACRILNDSRALAAHAKYIEAQLRYRTVRNLLTRLRAVVTVLSAGCVRSHSRGKPERVQRANQRGIGDGG
jgi:hypothetical protein